MRDMQGEAIDNELYERANPVAKTSVTTLLAMAGAGYQEDAEIIQRLGINPRDYLSGQGMDEVSLLCNLTIRELRHVVANRTILESGCDVVLDLPCGYTHRVLDMLREGKRYIGADLPSVIRSFEPVIRGMIPEAQQGLATFAEVDVTNYATIEAAVEGIEGPICLMMEGLLIYLNPDEKEQVFRNVHRLLSERGGCFLNTDFETLAYYRAASKAIARERADEMIQTSLQAFASQSDTDILGVIPSEVLSGRGGLEIDYDALERSFADSGLRVERIPYARDDLELRMFGRMTPDMEERVREAFREVYIWKLTVDSSFVEPVPRRRTVSEGDFSIGVESMGRKLSVRLAGRMDSLTAPVLLEAWEQELAAVGSFDSVMVDCAELAYLSSAGIRVLLMMRKALPEGTMVLTQVSPEVVGVLKMTGVDGVVDVR